VRAEASLATRLPDRLGDEHAAFLTLLRITLGAVRKSRIELGESVLVVGGGLIGQLAAQFAHAAGAGRVWLADVSEHRRRIAARAGLAEPLDLTTAADQAVIASAGEGDGPDVVIEATGAPEPIRAAFGWAGRLGRVVLLGSTRGELDGVDFYRDVHRKGLTVIGAHDSIRPAHDDRPGAWTDARDRRAALRLLETGRLNLDPLITHRFPATEFKRAYGLLFDWDEQVLGCVLHWPKPTAR
jgi:threonine dehydrogenase-like Zn-dependent dehydrogenase